MVETNNSLGKFLTKNKEYILLIVIVFLALLTLFKILGVSFKSTNDSPVYLKKKIVVETFKESDSEESDSKESKTEESKYNEPPKAHTDFNSHIKALRSNINSNKKTEATNKYNTLQIEDPKERHEHCSNFTTPGDCKQHCHCLWAHSYSHDHKSLHGHCEARDITTNTICHRPNYTTKENKVCHIEIGDHCEKLPVCIENKCKDFLNDHAMEYNENAVHHITDKRHPKAFENKNKQESSAKELTKDGDEIV